MEVPDAGYRSLLLLLLLLLHWKSPPQARIRSATLYAFVNSPRVDATDSKRSRKPAPTTSPGEPPRLLLLFPDTIPEHAHTHAWRAWNELLFQQRDTETWPVAAVLHEVAGGTRRRTPRHRPRRASKSTVCNRL